MPVKKNETWDRLYAQGIEHHAKGMDFSDITKALHTIHDDEALIFAVVKKIKTEHYAKSSREGRKFLLVGFGLIFTGFIITCVNFHSNQSITFAMYGLTSAGLTVVFYGLYKIIG